MSFDVRLTITGLQQAQDENLRAAAAVTPRGALGRAIKEVTLAAHRYEATIIHVDTGALKSSRVIKFDEGGLRGTVYSDPGAVNPRSGERPADYIASEVRRGGSHDSPGRTVREAGPRLEALAKDIIEGAIRG